MKQDIDILRIMDLIPHRYPFLLVDKILEFEGDEWAVGQKNVTANEPFFMGHFPKNPIMPGVLIVEAMAQTAGIIVMNKIDQTDFPYYVYFMSIEDVKFRRPVLPGDTLIMNVEKIKQRGRIWKYKGVAKVNDEVVAQATVSAALVSVDEGKA